MAPNETTLRPHPCEWNLSGWRVEFAARRVASPMGLHAEEKPIVNTAQKELVQTTFARLAVMPEVAGALFYERLFAENPDFRPLFKNNMRIQGIKLMTMLAMVVYNLPERDQVSTAIRDLAVRHAEYGVRSADYGALREALLWTLEQALGEDLTPAVREAWTVCYDNLADEMKAAAGV